MENSTITIIACVGKNLELGYKNKLVFTFKKDMAFFKEQTLGKTVVMGLNTFRSLPHMLIRRKHIVISNEPDYILPDNVIVVYSLESALNYINSLHTEVFIIGGASVYSQFLPYADKLLLTEVNESAIADVFFPNFDKSLYSRTILGSAQEDGVSFNFVEYLKKS